MRILIGLLVVGTFLVSSCKTIQPIDWASENTTQVKLPYLWIKADIHNIHKAVNKEFAIESNYKDLADIKPRIITIPNNIDSIQSKEGVEKDILRVYWADIKEHFLNNDSVPVGSICLKFNSFSTKLSPVLGIADYCTVLIPCLFGMPANRVKTRLIISVTISNKQNESIKTFIAEGTGTAYLAMYWGYGEDVWRKSAINAFKDAMHNFKQQLRTEQAAIRADLMQKEW